MALLLLVLVLCCAQCVPSDQGRLVRGDIRPSPEYEGFNMTKILVQLSAQSPDCLVVSGLVSGLVAQTRHAPLSQQEGSPHRVHQSTRRASEHGC